MNTGTLTVVVDMDKCSGLGMCEAVAPDIFEVQEDGHLRLLTEVACSSRRGELEEACDACPTQAISLQP